MRNEENIGDIKRGKHAITSLLLTCKKGIFCELIINQGKQKAHKT